MALFRISWRHSTFYRWCARAAIRGLRKHCFYTASFAEVPPKFLVSQVHGKLQNVSFWIPFQEHKLLKISSWEVRHNNGSYSKIRTTQGTNQNAIFHHARTQFDSKFVDKRLTKTLPVQFRPSPVYPGLHLHTYDPLVLLHSAASLQLWFPAAHSLISEKKCFKVAHGFQRIVRTCSSHSPTKRRFSSCPNQLSHIDKNTANAVPIPFIFSFAFNSTDFKSHFLFILEERQAIQKSNNVSTFDVLNIIIILSNSSCELVVDVDVWIHCKNGSRLQLL